MTKTNNTTRFIEIKPVGYYFFGNERTSRTVERDKYSQLITNYFATSNFFPQQTALLGMLRYALLAWQGKLNAESNEKEIVIGKENFHFEKDSPYGWIDRISPVIVFKSLTNEVFIPKGMDYQRYKKKGIEGELADVELSLQWKNEKHFNSSVESRLPVLQGFEYKEKVNSFWYSEKSGAIGEADIFKSVTKVGVDKEKQDEAFYKQTFHGLNKGFSFGVWVNFVEGNGVSTFTSKEIVVPFGADQGMFQLKLRDDVANPFEETHGAKGDAKKMVLLSDAWIEKELFEKVEFGITDYIDFRYIFSAKQNFYQMSDKAQTKHDDDLAMAAKSNKFVLMKRGSVLYPKPDFDFTLLNIPAFQRIGYNIYKTF